MHLACYSPKKRESLQQAFASQFHVRKKVAQRKIAKTASMRILRIIAYLSMQELLLLIICPSHLNPSMGNRLHTVKQILEADMYEIADLKVKIITKSQSKQSVKKNQVSMQKIDRYDYS